MIKYELFNALIKINLLLVLTNIRFSVFTDYITRTANGMASR